MRFLSSLVLSLVLSAGCAQRGKTPAYVIGGTTATVGAAMAVIAAARPDCNTAHLIDDLGCEAGKGWLYIGSAVLLAVGLTTIGVAASIETHEPTVGSNPFLPPDVAEPVLPAPASEDPRLRALTVEANVAAGVGRCDQVAMIASKVSELDRGYRIAGFVRDPAVRACLR
ncbi:MAG: hypothetical protein WKG01_41615 [Kofleriaceae bacterium]